MRRLDIAIMALFFLLAASCSERTGSVTMLVGTYDSDNSGGIYSYAFNPRTGEAVPKGHTYLRDASFLTLNSDVDVVYAVSERPDNTAALAAYSFDRDNLSFSPLSHSLTMGEDPCYVATNGKIVVTANYSGGSISVFRIGQSAEQSMSIISTRLFGKTLSTAIRSCWTLRI